MAGIKLKNISKIYDDGTKAVDDVSFNIRDKEFLVLVGPSGCGKTTTLRMIAGLEDISRGEIYIDDKLVNNILPKDRDIAMVFQNYALYPHMTVFDNMAFGLKLRKFPKDKINDRVHDAAKILGIEDLLKRKPKALSGGQRQRVAVGRALVRKPKVFLFDEPLSNLDAKLRVQMRTEISKLHNELDVTMVYVTHDQTEAMTMGDRIVILKDGTVQQIDIPLNLYSYPVNRFVAGFIGSPTMNFIEGQIKSNGTPIFISTNKLVSIKLEKFKTINFDLYKNKKILLGVRPEDIHIAEQNGFSIRVQVVEPLGNETLVYFDLEGKQTVARVPSTYTPAVNSEIKILLDVDKLHLFNFETGERLAHK